MCRAENHVMTANICSHSFTRSLSPLNSFKFLCNMPPIISTLCYLLSFSYIILVHSFTRSNHLLFWSSHSSFTINHSIHIISLPKHSSLRLSTHPKNCIFLLIIRLAKLLLQPILLRTSSFLILVRYYTFRILL